MAGVGFLVAPYRLSTGTPVVGVDGVADALAGLDLAAEAVLGREDRGELHTLGFADQVGQVASPTRAGLVGDQADALAGELGEARRGEHVGAGGDSFG